MHKTDWVGPDANLRPQGRGSPTRGEDCNPFDTASPCDAITESEDHAHINSPLLNQKTDGRRRRHLATESTKNMVKK
jgi:hypothetical protein